MVAALAMVLSPNGSKKRSGCLRSEGLLLDPVYTGRAAAGMIDLIRKGFFKRDETVLFLHTGGQTGAVRGAVC